MRLPALMFALASVAACGPTIDTGESAGETGASVSTHADAEAGASEDGQDAGDATAAGEGDATGADEAGTDGDPGLEKCYEACRRRDELIDTQGFCEVGWMSNLSCEETCEQVAAESGPAGLETVTVCIEEDPLCFQSLEMCVCFQVAPPDECAP